MTVGYGLMIQEHDGIFSSVIQPTSVCCLCNIKIQQWPTVRWETSLLWLDVLYYNIETY